MQAITIQQLSQNSYFFKWMCEQNLHLAEFPDAREAPQCGSLETRSQTVVITEKHGELGSEGHSSTESEKTEAPEALPKKAKKASKRAKKLCEDADYSAGCRKRGRQDPDFNVKVQNSDRNVMSNLCHHLLKFLQYNPIVAQLFRRIVEEQEIKYQLKQYYEDLTEQLKSMRTYVTGKHLRSLLFGNIQLITGQLRASGEFHLVTRLLAARFFRSECLNSIILSNKLSGESKRLHFAGIRKICDLILESWPKA